MKKIVVLMMSLGMIFTLVGCTNPLNKEIEDPVPAPIEEVVDQSNYHEKFLETMAKAIVFKQENLKKASVI